VRYGEKVVNFQTQAGDALRLNGALKP
jgi:hypothetical protein